MSARHLCAAAALVALCACASSEQRSHYEALHVRLEPAARAAGDGDPLRDAPVLERGALIALALQRNPGIESQRAAARAALARWPQETALPDPIFRYGLRPASLDSSQVDPAQDFELEQSLPFPGKRELRGERALAEADAEASGLDSERLALAALTSRLFDAYWLAERAVAANEQHLELVAGAREVALSRYASGRGPQGDVLSAEGEHAMLTHRAIELASERRILAERINTLLHRAPELELPAAEIELAPPAAAELDPESLAQRALRARPELRARESQIRAREADVSLARREFLPDFALRAAYEGSWQEDPLKPLVGIEINVPLALERRRAALAEAEARLTREQSRARKLEDQIRLEVASAVERVRESHHLLEVSRDRLLPAARDRVAGVQAAFASGRASFLEWVDAERALRSAEQAEREARASVSTRRAELARALGEIPGAGEGAR